MSITVMQRCLTRPRQAAADISRAREMFRPGATVRAWWDRGSMG